MDLELLLGVGIGEGSTGKVLEIRSKGVSGSKSVTNSTASTYLGSPAPCILDILGAETS